MNVVWSKNHCVACGEVMQIGEYEAISEEIMFFYCDKCQDIKFKAKEKRWEIDYEKNLRAGGDAGGS